MTEPQTPTALMIKFVSEMAIVGKELAALREELYKDRELLRQNNAVTKELYNVMDSFHQNVINYLKTSADINTVVGAATRLLKGR